MQKEKKQLQCRPQLNNFAWSVVYPKHLKVFTQGLGKNITFKKDKVSDLSQITFKTVILFYYTMINNIVPFSLQPMDYFHITNHAVIAAI